MRTILALCLLTATSCASLAPGPSETARAYADAIREGRSIDAWRLLSTTAREGMTFEAFEAALRARPDEVRALADTFAAARSDDGATATLELSDGERITLRSERGQWRLDPAALDFYPQNTPRQTLRAFVRAYRRGRWEVLLGLATRDVRDRLARMAAEGDPDGGAPRTAVGVLQGAWTAQANEVSQRVDALDHALTRGYAIEVAGERATMTYGPNAQLVARLVREDGRWFIEHTD
jgi:hypothetical protein